MNNATAVAISSPPTLRLRNWFVEHRVVISTLLFTALILEDVMRGRKPNSWLIGETLGLVGLGLVLAGVAVRSWAAGVLRKGKMLAETGPYSLCRHPLYLGSALMMIGFCLLIGEWHNLLYVCGPVALLYWMTIAKEETRISGQYAPYWPAYAARVPRVLPWRPALYKHGKWTLAQWLGNREYQALLGTIVGLALVELIRRY